MNDLYVPFVLIIQIIKLNYMIRNICSSLTAVVVVLCMSFITLSCDKNGITAEISSDINNLDDVALYSFRDKSAGISSLELTESSRYIIIRNTATKASTSEKPVIEGKYTKKDGTYNLEGFGTLTVEPDRDADGITSLTITETGKAPVTVQAAVTRHSSGVPVLTLKLCRTWNVDKEVEELIDKSSSSVVESSTYTPQNYKDAGDLASEVTFTKNGTILVKMCSGNLVLSSWEWSDKPNILKNFDYFDKSDDYFMEISITFDGDCAIMTSEEDDGEQIYRDSMYLSKK